MKRVLCLIMSMITAVAFCSCSDTDAAVKTVNFAISAAPLNIDPQLASSESELMIVRNTFEGLFRLNSDGDAVNAVCESYSVSDDGLSYKFTLREDAKWSDSSGVTAHDFVFGMQRALDPATGSGGASVLYGIVNAQKISEGTMIASNLGAVAADKHTLTVTLTEPDSDFITKLACAAAMPCNEDFFNKTSGFYGRGKSNILCNGPFTLTAWNDDYVRLARSEYYSGNFSAVPSGVKLWFTDDHEGMVENVRDGDFDGCLIDSSSASLADGLATETKYDTTWALLINPTAKGIGLNSVASLMKKAVNSESLRENVTAGFTASYGILADDLPVKHRRYRDLSDTLDEIPSDQQSAKNSFTAAAVAAGGIPAVTVCYIDLPGMKDAAASVARDWQLYLGLTVNIRAVTESELRTKLTSGNYQAALCPISTDDGTVASVADRFDEGDLSAFITPKAKTMLKRYYDADDDASAASALRGFEEIMTATNHIIPLYQSGETYVISSSVSGLKPDIYQGHIDFFNVS